MGNNSHRYIPLKDSELNAVWEKHKAFIEGFLYSNKIDAEHVFIDHDAVMSVIVKVDQRRKYFNYFHQLEMSEYKEAALNCFWYIKFKPLSLGPRDFARSHPDVYNSLNEQLGVYIIFVTLRAMLKAKKLSERPLDAISRKYVNELVYSFTYRDLSKESIILLVETMALLLGLDPYAKIALK